ncbi:hypothetical protein ABK040_011881 [Willaertia magna]
METLKQLHYGEIFTLRSVHGKMLTLNTHEYSSKTFLNAFVQITNDNAHLLGNAQNNDHQQTDSLAEEIYQSLYDANKTQLSPTHYGRFIMQPTTKSIQKDQPVCYGEVVQIFYIRDQDQKRENCGKYIVLNGEFPQLGFLRDDGSHQNPEPIPVSQIATHKDRKELLNNPVRFGEDIALKRIVCNQLDNLYLSCKKNQKVERMKGATNLGAWERMMICSAEGKVPVTPKERNVLINLYSQTNYLRDRTLIVSFRNQFKKALPKEEIPKEEELKECLQKRIGVSVQAVEYLDSMDDWDTTEEELEDSTSVTESHSEVYHDQLINPSNIVNPTTNKKIYTKYAKVVLARKRDRDVLGHLFYYELNKSIYLKFTLPKLTNRR